MNDIIFENILFGEEKITEKFESSEEHKILTNKVLSIAEKLKLSLNDEQKYEVNDLLDVTGALEYKGAVWHFKAGLKYGLRLAVECLLD